ncbi:hypothetical protein BGW80DRAFT_1324296 [Lactifluus volemus]|nr:hypothetical protein BGW80DRAFT_1324296 [Lactifluus volemus]
MQMHTPASNSSPTFSTIGQNPSLLQRMSDIPQVPPRSLSPAPDKEPPQKPTSTSRNRSRPALPRSFASGSPAVEPNGPTGLPPTPHANPLSAASPSPESPNDIKFTQFPDHIRASLVPDLQYPSPLREPAPTPIEQDTPSHFPQPLIVAPSGRTHVTDGTPDNPTISPSTSSQYALNDTHTEPDQVHRPVEHLIKLASARDERLLKLRETFEHRSGELSTFSMDALHATQAVHDRIEPLKQLAEETRTQAEQMLQEANKTRDLSDRLMASAEALSADMLSAKTHLGRVTERSEQMTRFVLKSLFDWLAALRTREQDKIAAVETELAEQAAAMIAARRQEELQRQLGRRKAEEQEKKEAAKLEEERESARKRAEEEEQIEAARKKSYDEQRAAVMADKRRANEVHAQSIQAERERRVGDASGSSSGSSIRDSNVPLDVSPREPINTTGLSTTFAWAPTLHSQPSSQLSVLRTPVGTAASPSVPRLLVDKTTPPPMCFVPAQTEAGRTVNTDLPLSSITLASELPPRNVGKTPQHPFSSQMSRQPVQEQMQPQASQRVALKLDWKQAGVKREPSIEEVPAQRTHPSFLQASPELADVIDHQYRERGTPTQDTSRDQHARTSSTSESHANSVHATQPEDRYHRNYPLARAPSQEGGSVHRQDFLHSRVIPTTDVARTYDRQDSLSSDRSPSPWNGRNRYSPSPPSYSRRPRSRSRSPSYPRKRARSGTPRFDTRQAVGPAFPPRGTYRTPSPPLSPRRYRYERSPLANDYRGRPFSAEYDTRQFIDPHVRERRMEEPRMNVNARRYDPPFEDAETRPVIPIEERERWHQHRQRPTPSLGERERTPTPPPRTGEMEPGGLLGRIAMNVADDRGRGRGRLAPGTIRGGPNTRRGIRGGFSGGRGRGTAPGPTPALLSRMTETTTHRTMAPAPTLSDRMRQD